MSTKILLRLLMPLILSSQLMGSGSDIRIFENSGFDKFSNLDLSGNADVLGQQQFKSWFSSPEGNDESGCMRGDAERLFQESPMLRSGFFRKKANSSQGLEAGVLKNGDELVVVSTGCEYYVLAIRFSFAEKPPSISNDPFWMKKAAWALKMIDQLKRPNAAFDFLKIAKVFEEAAKRKTPLTAAMDPTGDGSDFLETKVEINRVGYLPNKKGGFVEFNLSKGPL